jgi:hypothetical protein
MFYALDFWQGDNTSGSKSDSQKKNYCGLFFSSCENTIGESKEIIGCLKVQHFCFIVLPN